MYIYTCTDACAQSNQDVGPQEGGWDTDGGNRVIHICVQLPNVCGADVGSRVDMHICTDICTHSTQSLGPEKRYLAYACGATQGHPCLHVTNSSKQFCMQLCKGSGPDVGSQVGMHKCPDACTYSNKSFC